MATNTTSISAHSAADLFPMITGAEFDALKKDIEENGLQCPITLLHGEIIDGRNRMRACEELGIAPDFEELADDVDPLTFVASMNLHRRHLEPHERGRVYREIRNARGVIPGQNKGGRPKSGDKPSHDATVSERALAKELGVDKDTMRRQIQQADDYDALPPPLREKVDAKDVTVTQAKKAADKLKRVMPAIPPKDEDEAERERKTLEAMEQAAAEAKSEEQFRRWWRNTTGGFETWSNWFLSRRWGKGAMDGFRRDFERIENAMDDMRRAR